MKFLRFRYKGKDYCGVLDGDAVRPLEGDFFGRLKYAKCNEIPLSKVRILPPVLPSKIIAVGLNYIDHIEEFKSEVPKEPCIFLKAPTSVIAHSENIILPKMSKKVDYEAELAIVIKDKIKNISEKDAPKHILGFTCLNDVTARDLQAIDKQWVRAKSFDTFCPIGPYIVNGIDGLNIEVKSILNGVVGQRANTNKMVFTPYAIVSFASKVMTLLPGDVIATGTPGGSAQLKSGDVIEIDIENVGRLVNRVKGQNNKP